MQNANLDNVLPVRLHPGYVVFLCSTEKYRLKPEEAFTYCIIMVLERAFPIPI